MTQSSTKADVTFGTHQVPFLVNVMLKLNFEFVVTGFGYNCKIKGRRFNGMVFVAKLRTVGPLSRAVFACVTALNPRFPEFESRKRTSKNTT